MHRGSRPWDRRNFLRAGLIGTTGLALADSVEMPFEFGSRPLVKYPQKRPLIRLTTRPPQLETPFSVFNESLLTPNDAFYVRYHLTNSPPKPEALQPDQFRLTVKGKVATPLTLSVEELKTRFENAEVVAVNHLGRRALQRFRRAVAPKAEGASEQLRGVGDQAAHVSSSRR